MTPSALQSYARAKLAESRSLIFSGTEQQREQAVVDFFCEGYGYGRLDGLNAGAAAYADGARQAHAAAIQPITT